MMLELLVKLLRAHLAALESEAWPRPHGPSNGPALYLDAADTRAVMTELIRLQRELEISAPAVLKSSEHAPSHAGTLRDARSSSRDRCIDPM